jgi:poly(3-hydroxybutyrate) depolymerase
MMSFSQNGDSAHGIAAPNFIYLAPDGGIPAQGASPGFFIWQINNNSQTTSSQCGPGTMIPNCPDDNGFLRALIQRYINGTQSAGHPLDPNKVFVAGFSAGAAMALQTAVTSGDLVAAVFSNEGLFPWNPSNASGPPNILSYGPPAAPVSVLLFKGQFGTFPFCGQYGNPQSIFSVDEAFSYFTAAGADNCGSTTTSTFCSVLGTGATQGTLPTRIGTGVGGAKCANGTEVKAYQAFCGEHWWYNNDITANPCTPGQPPPPSTNTGSINNPDFGAQGSGVTTDAFIWNFFATHPKTTGATGGVTLDSVSAVQPFNNAQTSVSWNHTASGSNRYGIVEVGMYDGGNPTSVTWGGIAMTLLGSQDNPADTAKVRIYGLVAPPTGSQTISITMNNSPGSAMSISYNGVNQRTPTGTAAGNTVAGSTATSSSVATASGDMVVSAFGTCSVIFPTTVSSPATQRGSGVGTGTTCGAGGADGAGTGGNVSVTWNNGNSSSVGWAMVTVDLKHASSQVDHGVP